MLAAVGAILAGQQGAVFSPGDIPGLEAWYDDTTVQHSAGAVSGWNDRSVNGRNLGNTLGSPRFGDVQINGVDVVTLASASSECIYTTSAFWEALGDSTMFVVGRTSNSGALMYAVSEGLSSSVTPFHGVRRHNAESDFDYVHRNDAGSSTEFLSGIDIPTNDTPFIGACIRDQSASAEVRVDGVAGSTAGGATTGATTLDRFAIGALLRTSSAAFWEGEIAEVIIYSGVLSAGNIADVEAYLASKWGVTI